MADPLIPLIVVNLAANHGRSKKKWQKIKTELLDRFEQYELVTYEPPFDLKSMISDSLRKGKVNCFLYGGGDGTMNQLLNHLMEQPPGGIRNYYFGGIGLGSSNDFQKPFGQGIQGVPCRLRLDNALLSDVGWVTFEDQEGISRKKHFLINASLGVTADANLLFNRGDAFIRGTKALLVDLAIIYAALKTIATYRNIPIRLSCNGEEKQLDLTNLAILKMPNVSGSFKYSQPIRPDDGQLGVNVCEDMNRWELLDLLRGLASGRFDESTKKWSCFTTSLRVSSEVPLSLETDGEVYQAGNIAFGLYPKHIKLLGR